MHARNSLATITLKGLGKKWKKQMHISQRMDVSKSQHRIGVMSISAQVSIAWLKRTDKFFFSFIYLFFCFFDGEKCIMHVEKYRTEGYERKGKRERKTGSLSSSQLNKWITEQQ